MMRPTALCPYVGLQPFREEDYPYFFGRERDVRIISSNLLAQPLTVVYGASGVGKSSVLRAGVLPHLRTNKDAVAVYYNTWQREFFLKDLTGQCCAALKGSDPDAQLDELIGSGGRRLFLVLDQFEELLLYHRAGKVADEFDSVLARIVNRDDLAVNVVIGIREDSLSRFDQRYSIRIADLLGNTLPLDHLTKDAARRAILEPLRVFNERQGLGPDGYSIEPELTDEILRQVQPQQFAATDDDGRTTAPSASGHGRVETPFLQLVLRRLWEEENGAGSRKLRMETLRRIGGARQIVEKHVHDVLASLPADHDREIAAWMFKFLVTPSRSKIAQTTEDLIGYAEASEADVRRVLAWLSDKPESRILRRLETPERYEIFHDVLAQPILDWRKKYFAEKQRLEEDQKRRVEAERARREVRRMRWLAGGMVLLAIAAAGFAWYAFDQRARVSEAAGQLQLAHQEADANASEAQAVREQARAAEDRIRASEAELAGQKGLADQLRASAAESAKQAQELTKTAEEQRSEIAGYLDGKDKNYRDAVQQISDLRLERDRLQTQVSSLTAEVKQLKEQIADRDKKTPPQAQAPQAQSAPPAPSASSELIHGTLLPKGIDPGKTLFRFSSYEALPIGIRTIFNTANASAKWRKSTGPPFYEDMKSNAPSGLATILNVFARDGSLNLWQTEPSLFGSIESFYDIAQDRFYAWVRPDFLERARSMVSGGSFVSTAQSLSKPLGFSGAALAALRTTAKGANIHLLFYREELTGRLMIDAHIDENTGLSKAVDVIQMAFKQEQPINSPSNIHQQLVTLGIDPLYMLQPRPKEARVAEAAPSGKKK